MLRVLYSPLQLLLGRAVERISPVILKNDEISLHISAKNLLNGPFYAVMQSARIRPVRSNRTGPFSNRDSERNFSRILLDISQIRLVRLRES